MLPLPLAAVTVPVALAEEREAEWLRLRDSGALRECDVDADDVRALQARGDEAGLTAGDRGDTGTLGQVTVELHDVRAGLHRDLTLRGESARAEDVPRFVAGDEQLGRRRAVGARLALIALRAARPSGQLPGREVTRREAAVLHLRRGNGVGAEVGLLHLAVLDL